MQTFTVHEPPNPPADRIDRAQRVVFVKEGFSWGAALLAPFWLLVHRIWWPLLGYILLAGGFEAAKHATALDQRWIGLCILALNLMVGFEADVLRRWALERRGWHMLGAVTGKNLAECERRFFESWLPSQPILTPSGGAGQGRQAAGAPRTWWGALIGARS
jgi:hypothetical protein